MGDTVEARPAGVSDAWELRIAVGTTMPDLCYRLARALPGVMRLVDARPDDGTGMVVLVFAPPSPEATTASQS